MRRSADHSGPTRGGTPRRDGLGEGRKLVEQEDDYDEPSPMGRRPTYASVAFLAVILECEVADLAASRVELRILK